MHSEITIIIPTYNASKTIDTCLSSIERQTFQNFNVIVVDDGSEDDTVQIARKYAKNIRFTVLKQNNRGPSAARNAALDLVVTPLVTFMDADDVLEATHLEELQTQMTNSSVDLAVVGYLLDYGEGKQKGSVISDGIFDVLSTYDHILKHNGMEGYVWNKVFRTSIINKYHIKFDEKIFMAEDLLFCIQYLNKSKVISVKNVKTYRYMQHSNSISKSVFNPENLQKEGNSMIEAYLKIESFLPPVSKNIIQSIKGYIAWESGHILRNFDYFFSNLKPSDRVFRDKILKYAKENEIYLLHSKEISLKRKIYFEITLRTPVLSRLLMKLKRVLTV